MVDQWWILVRTLLQTVSADYSNTCWPASLAPLVPDVSELDSDILKLLASQRLQQLFAKTKQPPSYKTLNGLAQGGESFSQQSREPAGDTAAIVSPPSTIGVVMPSAIGPLQSAKAVLCPFSYSGPVYPIHKCVVTIGTSSLSFPMIIIIMVHRLQALIWMCV